MKTGRKILTLFLMKAKTPFLKKILILFSIIFSFAVFHITVNAKKIGFPVDYWTETYTEVPNEETGGSDTWICFFHGRDCTPWIIVTPR